MTKSMLEQLRTCRDLLELREHDIDRLFAKQEAVLRLVLALIKNGHVTAAKEIIRRQLGERP
ncbi:hypothetical protein [Mesorhizobium captivum]|uniref:hypothetical protein n=1 Tax=Mesorhizobium captivum TaxID=3072319 RepID=UPI002A240F59|nr:hypothetical protein [Mesorhizobium sp. VK3C]MDX8450701.1 hypothetical protein [Mesorhizobium sp. VK3C]